MAKGKGKKSTFRRSGPAGAPPKPGKNDLRAGGASLKRTLPIGES